MRRSIIFALWLGIALLPAAAQSQGLNPLPLIIQAESSGNPKAQSPSSSASGLAGDVNGTWAAALTACGGACGSVAQFPTAASAPASVQIAANNALINAQGLQPWLCAGCDDPFAAAVAAAGGVGAFQLKGLDINPADFAAADSAAGLQAFLGSPLAAGGLGVGAAAGAGAPGGDPAGAGAAAVDLAAAGGGGETIVTNQPGTSAGPGGGVLDTIASQFQGATAGWQAALFNIATDLFWILAGIELFVILIMMMVNGGVTLVDVTGALIRWLFAVGLFSWLMLNASDYATDIINSLRQAGGAIGSYALTPSAVFQAGVNIVTTVWNNYHGFWGTLELIPVMIALIPIEIAFAMASIWMLMILIESYFVVGLAVLLLAFGALRWTRQIAVSLLLACVSVGFKLLAIEAIAPLAVQLITQIAQTSSGLSFQGIFTVLGTGFAFAALMKIIPDRIERIVLNMQPSLAHHESFRREAVTTAAVAVGAVAAAGGAGALAFQALKLAAEQQTQGGQGNASGGLQLASGAAGAMGSAMGAEISGRLGGLYRGGPGASATRMASNVAQQRRVAAAERVRPAPPGGGNP